MLLQGENRARISFGRLKLRTSIIAGALIRTLTPSRPDAPLRWRRFLPSFLTLSAIAFIGAGKPADVAYTVSPEIHEGALTALDVSLALRAGPDGRVTLQLPDASAGVTELWRYLRDLEVEGATAVTAPKPAERLIEARPGASIVVRYRVVSAYDQKTPVNGVASGSTARRCSPIRRPPEPRPSAGSARRLASASPPTSNGRRARR
jgi:hypothetical protein